MKDNTFSGDLLAAAMYIVYSAEKLLCPIEYFDISVGNWRIEYYNHISWIRWVLAEFDYLIRGEKLGHIKNNEKLIR